jgi:hypothetical protein
MRGCRILRSSRFFDNSFQVLNSLLYFSRYLFAESLGFQGGIVCQPTHFLLKLALQFTKRTLAFIFRASSNHGFSLIDSRKMQKCGTAGQGRNHVNGRQATRHLGAKPALGAVLGTAGAAPHEMDQE